MQTATRDQHITPSSGKARPDLAALTALIAAGAPRLEEERRLSAGLATTLAGHGLFRMLVPRALGGGEVAPAALLDTIETLAAADGSVAWCVMVCATTGMLAACLDEEAAAEIFGDPDAIVGGVAAPRGVGVARGDGVEVSGRWPWASASAVCTWLMAGFRGGTAGEGPHLAFLPARQVRLIDDWFPAGLRGTGSGTFEAAGLFAPARRTCAMSVKPRAGASPLYAIAPNVMGALCMASVGCGLARAAFDAIAAQIEPNDQAMASIAEALARQCAARALLREQVQLAWEKACAGDDLPTATIAHLRLAAVHAARTSADTCRSLQDMAGGAGVPFDSPLARRARDAQTVTAHALVSPRLYQQLGEQLLG
ncbi:MAG: hypothetical protein V4475_07500 [Pseudomonadota bacterium]